jgi:PhnB protein
MAKPAKRKTATRPAKRSARAKARTAVRPVPPGYHTVTPYLTVRDGARALDFYTRAFGAAELMRMPGPGGTLMHAEFRIGNSIVMLSDEIPGVSSCKAPTSLGGTTVQLSVYLPDVDAAFKRAVDAGCKVLMPLTDMFWGDRYGKLEDPFGNQWGLATHKEDLTPEEIGRRARAATAQMPGKKS